MNSEVVMKKQCCSKKSFTLIELLVVIAIIAILAAMLMPALQQARESAKTTDCKNNIKSAGTILQFYRGDFRDYIYTGDNKGIGNNLINTATMSWAQRLYNYKYLNGWKTVRCPSGNYYRSPSDATYDEKYGSQYTYGIVRDEIITDKSRGYMNLGGGWVKTYGFGSKTLSNVAPSSVFLFGDSVYVPNGFMHAIMDLTNGQEAKDGRLALVHKMTANAGFLDGHAGTVGKAGWVPFPQRRTDGTGPRCRPIASYGLPGITTPFLRENWQ